MTSLAKFGTITGTDFLKGLVVAVLTTALTAIYNILQTNTLPTLMQLKQIGIVAFIAGVSYVVKNMFTNSQDQLFTPEPTPTDTIPATAVIAVPAPVPVSPVQVVAPAAVPNV